MPTQYSRNKQELVQPQEQILKGNAQQESYYSKTRIKTKC